MTTSKDLTHLLSEESKSRGESPLKAVIKYRSIPGMRSLAGGLPLPVLFPFDDLSVKSPEYPFTEGIALPDYVHQGKSLDVNVNRNLGVNDVTSTDFSTSLQYGSSQGNAKVLEFVKEHTSIVHKLPYEDWDIIMSIGNSFAWDAVLRTFVNRGEPILVEEFAFSSALEAAQANGAVPIGVKMDLEGIIPEALEEQMRNWVGPRPKLLYTVPTGQNPTGSSLSSERRQKVYEIACKYDFLIVEDEPYYYLQFPKYEHPAPGQKHDIGLASNNNEFVESLDSSFLNFDTEGRVLRLDSFSKVIAPGTRMSWIVGQKRFIERLLRLHEVSSQNVCGFSTAIVYGLLSKWGHEGYLSWLNNLSSVYSQARDVACDAIYEHFPKGKYDFEPPVAGMFFWFKVDARRCKKFVEFGRDPIKCEDALIQEGIDRKVMLVPGHWFVSKFNTTPPQPKLPESDDEKYAMYFRGTFAGVNTDALKQALTEFGQILNEELLDEIQE